jgi:N-acetylmuramoyl-L-alanine amidase
MSLSGAVGKPTRPESVQAAPRSQSAKASPLQDSGTVAASSIASRFGLRLSQVNNDRQFTMRSSAWLLQFEVDSRDCIIGGQRVFLGAPVRMIRGEPHFSRIDADRLISPILRPGYGQSAVPRLRTIVLDAGHGGSDSGKTNAKLGLMEKTLTLDTVMRIKRLLERDGYRVLLTRSDDRFVPLPDRPELAEKSDADLFVSVHFNSVVNSADTVTGIEVYTMAPRNQLSTDQHPDPTYAPIANPGNANDHWNSVLGYAVHKSLQDELSVSDRGMKRSRYAVLRLAPCPAVLIESGFLSNDVEARRLATPSYRQRIAEGIASGIARYATLLEGARRSVR